MKPILCICIVAILAAGSVRAQPAPATTTAASTADVDPILDALDQRGKQLLDFTANVAMTITDVGNGTSNTVSGKMWMQRLPNDDARLRVTFDHKNDNGETEKIHQEYELAGGHLVDRNYDRHKEDRYQVLKPGQKMNLLKLGEGPFPLPLGQDKADVHKMFEVKRLPSAKDDPPNTEHVQLIPRPGTDFARKFSSIDFAVDIKLRFPVRIVTQDKNQTETRTTVLTDVQVNQNLTDKDFALEPVNEKEWTITDQPYED